MCGARELEGDAAPGCVGRSVNASRASEDKKRMRGCGCGWAVLWVTRRRGKCSGVYDLALAKLALLRRWSEWRRIRHVTWSHSHLTSVPNQTLTFQPILKTGIAIHYKRAWQAGFGSDRGSKACHVVPHIDVTVPSLGLSIDRSQRSSAHLKSNSRRSQPLLCHCSPPRPRTQPPPQPPPPPSLTTSHGHLCKRALRRPLSAQPGLRPCCPQARPGRLHDLPTRLCRPLPHPPPAHERQPRHARGRDQRDGCHRGGLGPGLCPPL